MPNAILDPTGRTVVEESEPATVRAPRRGALTGARVGLLDNTKHNAMLFLQEVGRLLVDEHGAAEVSIVETKRSFSVPVDDEIVARYRKSADVVVTGVGDCGSCSAAAVADGIALERAGIPTAVICTEAFASTSQAMAELKGDPDFPYILTEHPVANLDAGQLVDRAAHLVPDVVARLTAPASASAQSAADSALSVPV